MTDEISKMLTLSTAHVTKFTADMFHYNVHKSVLPVYYSKGEYGWLVHIHELDDDMSVLQYPTDIQELIAYARSLGCEWLCLDQDGPINPNLPSWEW